MKSTITTCRVIAVFFIIIGLVLIYNGFDKKDAYYYSEYSSLNKNAYVGGDAYNYIINANYFTGYVVLGGIAILSAVLLICTSIYLKNQEILSDRISDSGLNAANDITDELPPI